MSQSKNILISHAQIEWSDQSEPFSPLFEDVYFNTDEGVNESLYVFIQGNRLEQRWQDCLSPSFTIAETGFGTGLNFLITCLEFQRFKNKYPNSPLKQLNFCSFEKYPLTVTDLKIALARWPLLNEFITPLLEQYPQPIAGCHHINIEPSNIYLDLWFGDVIDNLPLLVNAQNRSVDCWYLDGFAPSKNPDMWSKQLFQKIADSCKPDATIATFTAAGFVRRGLIDVGFNMQKRAGYGKKREMIVGQFMHSQRHF